MGLLWNRDEVGDRIITNEDNIVLGSSYGVPRDDYFRTQFEEGGVGSGGITLDNYNLCISEVTETPPHNQLRCLIVLFTFVNLRVFCQ